MNESECLSHCLENSRFSLEELGQGVEKSAFFEFDNQAKENIRLGLECFEVLRDL
jgi:hypothetical protein